MDGAFGGGIHSELLVQKWTFCPKSMLANFYILLSTNNIVWGYFTLAFLCMPPLSRPGLRLLLCHCLLSRSCLLLRSHLQLPAPLPLVAPACQCSPLVLWLVVPSVSCCTMRSSHPLPLVVSLPLAAYRSLQVPLILWLVVAPPPLKPPPPLALPLL